MTPGERIPSLAALYDDNLRSEVAGWTDIWRNGVDESLAEAGEIAHTTSRSILEKQLDTLEGDHRRSTVAKLLGCLPITTLTEDFGPEVFGWTIGNDLIDRIKIRAEEIESEGFDIRFLEAARNLSYNRDTPSPRGRDVIAHNAVIEAVLGTTLEKVDVHSLVKQSAGEHITKPISDKRAADYGLIPLQMEWGSLFTRGRVYNWEGQSEIESSNLIYPMYLDAPVGLALTYKGAPQAIASFIADGPDGLMIHQMQGVRGVVDPYNENARRKPSRGLAPLDWHKLLVGAGVQLAELSGLESVAILNGKQVPSWNYNHITPEAAQKGYDWQAERFGFTQGEDGIWRMPVAAVQQQLFA